MKPYSSSETEGTPSEAFSSPALKMCSSNHWHVTRGNEEVSFSRSALIEGVASVTVSALVTTESLTGLQCNSVDVGLTPPVTSSWLNVQLCRSYRRQTEASEPVWLNRSGQTLHQRCWTLRRNFFASSSGNCILFSTCLPHFLVPIKD